jgi:RES domain-containing protein
MHTRHLLETIVSIAGLARMCDCSPKTLNRLMESGFLIPDFVSLEGRCYVLQSRAKELSQRIKQHLKGAS